MSQENEGQCPVCRDCKRPSPSSLVCPECSALPRRSYAEEHEEWKAIAVESVSRGENPSAWDVSEEQRRRMAARGERASTLEEIGEDVRKMYEARS